MTRARKRRLEEFVMCQVCEERPPPRDPGSLPPFPWEPIITALVFMLGWTAVAITAALRS